ncbi:stage V sporulation protein AC [Alkaliphilus sp. MSJ-5]|uniref:Stage V sporulation protein AC n=1 Tax=Alkaliphilus flagellatus TaxID=2841507 RepID=A0ABS6G8D5_9FIRM|nr:stage V sporulation protein AC [Alkaliphilus flagellatus]MBU5677656.1 stage V sporulation protein AC [Alkaliphilus flagellatus]
MSKNQANKNKAYQNYVDTKIPKPHLLKNCIWAFLVGGAICTIGEVIHRVIESHYKYSHLDVSDITTLIMVFIGAFLTGIGIYDIIGKRAGAGSLIPITGFANSIVAPAMEFKREGFIMGVAAKMFVLAGPVLVYGIGSSVIVGILYYIFKK